MKSFLPLGIAGRIVTIFLVSTGLYAQNTNRLEATNQVTGCSLQTTGSRKATLPPEDQVERRIEPTANCQPPTADCDNALHCHLMMNPAMVEESEEAIEKFILGETKSALPITRSNYTENQTREQVTANQGFTTKSTLSSQSLLNHTATSSIPTSRFNRQEEEKEFFSSRDDASFTEEALSSSNYSAKTEQPSEENSGIFSKLTGYFSKAVELARTTVDSLYLCPPEAVYDFAASDLDVSQQLELKDEATTTPEEEFSSQELKTSTSTDTTIRQSGSIR